MSNAHAAHLDGARLLYYCHDSYGLGHLRRTLALATHVQRVAPDASQLIVTGSPVANRFKFPEGTDYVKLPSVTKTPAGEYVARSIDAGFADIHSMREEILLSTARHFRPDIFIVDHVPGGLRGEAVRSLRHLKRGAPNAKLVVGLRDVLDEPEVVRRTWRNERVHDLLDDVYDLILVYGHRAIFDVVRAYDFSERAAAKTRFIGYIGRELGARPPDEVRAELRMRTDRLVLVTTGGGGDGSAVYDAILRDLREAPGALLDCVLIGGPLQTESQRAALRAAVAAVQNAHFIEFTDDLGSYLRAADVVVSMGGYNSVCEILCAGSPAIIVPRLTPRQEQLIRSNALRRRGLVEVVLPTELAPGRLLGEVERLLDRASRSTPGLAMDGLHNFVDALGTLLARERRPLPPEHSYRPAAAAFAAAD